MALAASQPAFVAHATDLGAAAAASSRSTSRSCSRYPDETAVEAEAQAVSTPGSPLYRHFLTTAQFRARFSPSAAAVTAVSSWVRSAGLAVKSVAPSRLYVEVTGTMAQAEKLVGARLDTFRYQGQVVSEPVADYRIPAGSRQHRGRHRRPRHERVRSAKPAATLPGPPPGVRFGVQPCSDYYGQIQASNKPQAYGQTWPYTICGYDAKQYESAFGLSSSIAKGLNGKGVTVAITDAYAAPTILSDANRLVGSKRDRPVRARPVRPGHARTEWLQPGGRVRAAGLVRRGDPRRRVRPRHGSRGEHPLRRGYELRCRPQRGLGLGDRQPSGQRGDELLAVWT